MPFPAADLIRVWHPRIKFQFRVGYLDSPATRRMPARSGMQWSCSVARLAQKGWQSAYRMQYRHMDRCSRIFSNTEPTSRPGKSRLWKKHLHVAGSVASEGLANRHQEGATYAPALHPRARSPYAGVSVRVDAEQWGMIIGGSCGSCRTVAVEHCRCMGEKSSKRPRITSTLMQCGEHSDGKEQERDATHQRNTSKAKEDPKLACAVQSAASRISKAQTKS
ncbi:hypothetical protein DFH11DRAFT_1544714 [Phellopilus nigrolimitatus]|nr:hypothetical protein DFH11DRAFT_1544714 [Phellopilus nigrolimitatus]